MTAVIDVLKGWTCPPNPKLMNEPLLPWEDGEPPKKDRAGKLRQRIKVLTAHTNLAAAHQQNLDKKREKKAQVSCVFVWCAVCTDVCTGMKLHGGKPAKTPLWVADPSFTLGMPHIWMHAEMGGGVGFHPHAEHAASLIL
jgi:hypothetical protein